MKMGARERLSFIVSYYSILIEYWSEVLNLIIGNFLKENERVNYKSNKIYDTEVV